ncbi:MAG: hypothetical protein AAB640_00710 [Patescibacteria group bacterium]
MRRLTICFKILFTVAAVFLLGQLGTSQVWADTVGERHTFFVNPIYDATGRTSVSVTLEYVGTHAYFYVEDAYLDSLRPSERIVFNQQIAVLAQEFDNNIYPKETAFWGSEANPGIDNDSKITILLERLTSGTGGYFDSVNGYTTTQSPQTNQREMIMANVLSLSTSHLKIFLAHELQHLISFNQKELLRDASEDTWLNELRSQYAVTLVGYNDNFQNSDLAQRLQIFLNNSADSLTEWPNTNLDYAVVTLFGQYLVDRFGPAILQETLRSSSTGIDSINKYLANHQSLENFGDVFADWVWTNYYNNRTQDVRYGYINPNLQTIHVSPTDSKQLTSQNLNSYFYSLKPWQSAWYQFRTDSLAPAGQNIKISWPDSEFQIYYADASGVERRVSSGDIIAPPPTGTFILMPVNESQTTNFGTSEVSALLTLSIEYTNQPVLTLASAIQDGSLIMHAGTPDIYVIWGTYKRYLAPEVLKFYGLDPAKAITVPESVFQSYMPSNYIRVVNEKKVYAVWPDGTKHWLNMTAQHFTDSYRDWNSVFIVNNLESSFYKLGPDITQ